VSSPPSTIRRRISRASYGVRESVGHDVEERVRIKDGRARCLASPRRGRARGKRRDDPPDDLERVVVVLGEVVDDARRRACTSPPPSSSAVTSSPVAAFTSGGPPRKIVPCSRTMTGLVAHRGT
jgi:hypothetical protein